MLAPGQRRLAARPRTRSTSTSSRRGSTSCATSTARAAWSDRARVVGRYASSVGPMRAGDRYSANQIAPMLWVAATVTDTTVHTYEALIGPLSLAEKDQLVAEAPPRAVRLPRSPRPRPRAAPCLQVGEDSRALARAVLATPAAGSEPAYAVLRRLTARWLPASLRTAYGMDSGPIARATGATLEAAIRAAVPRLPHSLRICPARLHAERRLRGEDGPDPGAVRIERLLASMLGMG
nr:oxygenase MpaB family protein [Nannocystis sp.]